MSSQHLKDGNRKLEKQSIDIGSYWIGKTKERMSGYFFLAKVIFSETFLRLRSIVEATKENSHIEKPDFRLFGELIFSP